MHATSRFETGFARLIVVGGLLSIALLLAATTLRGAHSGGVPSHDDRPVLVDR